MQGEIIKPIDLTNDTITRIRNIPEYIFIERKVINPIITKFDIMTYEVLYPMRLR